LNIKCLFRVHRFQDLYDDIDTNKHAQNLKINDKVQIKLQCKYKCGFFILADGVIGEFDERFKPPLRKVKIHYENKNIPDLETMNVILKSLTISIGIATAIILTIVWFVVK